MTKAKKRQSLGSPVGITRETVTPHRYLEIASRSMTNIAKTRVVPPKMGTPGFGLIEIEYRKPVYRFIPLISKEI